MISAERAASMAFSSRVLTPIVLAASLVLLPICSPTAVKVSEITLARDTSWASASETCSLIFCAIEFGAVGQPPLDFADLIGDPCGSRLRPLGHALIRRCKGLLDRLGAFGKLGRALMRAGDDLLLGIAENACNVGRAGNELLLGFVEHAGNVARAGDDLLLGFVEHAGNVAGAGAERLGAFADACGDLAIDRNRRRWRDRSRGPPMDVGGFV